MKKEADPGINFFQRYLTIWVFLCMVVGVLLGHFAPVVPALLARLEYARVSIPMAILIWVMIYPMMLKVDFNSVRNVGKNPKGVVCDMDCQLAYKTFYNVWHCQLVFLRDFQGIYYA